MNPSTESIDDLAATLLLASYDSSRPELVALYERAKARQWNATTDLDWSLPPVDGGVLHEHTLTLYGTARYAAMPDDVKRDYARREAAWILSQFMHGEQASLLACGQLVAALPDMDSKFYAASQAYDEARHTEVYRRYLSERVKLIYPIDVTLQFIVETALAAGDWTLKLVGIQLLVESLAMGAFKTLLASAHDPLLAQLLASVMQDEARHVAFGRIQLEAAIAALDARERDDYEDFVCTAAEVMYDGFFPAIVFDELGYTDLDAVRGEVMASELRAHFRRDLFSVLVPNTRAIGLLTQRTLPRYAALGLATYADGAASAVDGG